MMTSRGSTETSRWPVPAYLLILIVGLLEVWVQWTRNFDPLAFADRLDLVVLYLPPIAIVASVLALLSRDGTLRLLAGGFLLVVIFQFAFWLLPYWGLESYVVYGVLNGYDAAWGVMCVIAWPLSMLARRWTISGWQVSGWAFLALIAILVLLSVCWQPEREAFTCSPPPRQARQEIGLNDAACEGDMVKIEQLVAAGARIGAETHGGWTPLMFAVERGEEAVVRELLKRGASPDSQEYVYGSRVSYMMFKSTCLPDTTAPTNGATALMIAAPNGHVDIVRILLEAGADPRKENKDGKTALELAQAAGQLEVVALLREAEA